MPYTRQYEISNLNFNGITCAAIIRDTTSFSDAIDIGQYAFRQINGGGNPITIASVDADESKFNPIRAKRCTIQFLSSNSFNLTLFSEGEDNRWMVSVIVDRTEIFTGFLVLDDCREPYQPHPNVVTLTATDGLGLLKEVPLTDLQGKNPKGKYPIIQFIAWALAKTGLQLSIRLINNLVEESSVAGSPFYKDIYLDAKTFEGPEIGTCISCYEVLKRIFGYDSFLQQRNGEWWIMRIDEMQAGEPVYPHRFNYEGHFMFSEPGVMIDYEVGSKRDSHFIHANQEVTLIRKHKFDKLTFKYDYPEEILDNINFSRGGQLLPVIVPDKKEDGKVYTGSAYRAEDWQVVNNSRAVTASAQIIRYFFEGYEKERYLKVFPAASQASPWDYVRTNPIPVHFKDRMELSVDFRLEVNLTGNAAQGQYIFTIYLHGADGKYYCYRPDTKGWYGGLSSIAGTNYATLHTWNNGEIDETFTWQTHSVKLPPVPIDGDLYVGLYNGFTWDNNRRVIHYTNLRLTYEPYINGSYREFSGHYNKVELGENYKANTDDEVFIGDSPKKLFKGAMFKKVNGLFVLAGLFYNAAVFRSRPTSEYFNTYGKTQIYAVHNQFNRTFRMIAGSVQNMNETNSEDMPDSMRIYKIAEVGAHAEGRRFLLTGFNQNLRLGEWQATLLEVHGPEGKDYSAKHEFKYV